MTTGEANKLVNTAARFYLRQRNRRFAGLNRVMGGAITGIDNMSIQEVAQLFDADLGAVRSEVAALDARI